MESEGTAHPLGLDARYSPALFEAAEATKWADGRWVLIRKDVNVCHLTRLRTGRVAPFRPVEDFEFRSVKGEYPKNRCDIYARYVGA